MINLLKIGVFVLILTFSFFILSTIDPQIISDQTLPVKLILFFIAGLSYTSFLTTPFAVIFFVFLPGTSNIYLIALVAGLGAVVGDLFIVKFFRTIFKAFSFVRHAGFFKVLKKKLQSYHLDIVANFLGLLIVASPLPDELGLILLGATKLSYFQLAIFTYIANCIGILMILYTTKAIT